MKIPTNINVKFDLKINGMTIGEFQEEIEELYDLLEEIKQLSMFRDEENMTCSEIDDTHISNLPYIEPPKR